MFTKITFAAALVAATATAGNSDEWKQRSVYQVLTDRFARSDGSTSACGDLSGYCGGNYQGMIDKLDYIKGMGFDAIWISPIVDNTDGGYHGYWARNWEEVNGNFGTKDDLKALVDAAHEKGIWVMVDVVANHTGPVGTDFSQLYPFNKSEHFHSDCQITNWNDQGNVEYCRLADLPDLNQDNDFVRSYLKDWVKGIVQDYGFDGIRIDTIPEVPKDFWLEYGEASGVFQMGECFNGDPAYVGPYQQDLTALFNYPMYYSIGDVFGSGKSMYDFRNRYNTEDSDFKNVDLLGIFVDNHDNARFLSRYGKGKSTQLKSAVTFTLTARGIPFTYYGTEQYYAGGNDPQNRESLWQDYNVNSDLYQQMATVNAQRKKSQIWNETQVERYVDDSFYAYSRGEFLVALTNDASNTQHRQVTYQPFSDGTVVCNVFYPTTDCQTVNGMVDVYLANGESKIYVPQDKLASVILEKYQDKNDASCDYEFGQACRMRELCGTDCNSGCDFSWPAGDPLKMDSPDVACRCNCSASILDDFMRIPIPEPVPEPEPVKDETCAYEFGQACRMRELCGTDCNTSCDFSWPIGDPLQMDSPDLACRCNCSNDAIEALLREPEVVPEPEPVVEETCAYEFGPACRMRELCGTDCNTGCDFSWPAGDPLKMDSPDLACRCNCSSEAAIFLN